MEESVLVCYTWGTSSNIWKNKDLNTRRGRQESDYGGEASVRKGTTGVDSDFLKPEAFGFS